MNHRTLLFATAMLGALAVIATPNQAVASIISIDYNDLTVVAHDLIGSPSSNRDIDTGLHRTNTIVAEDGLNRSSATLNWSTDNPGAGLGIYQVLDFVFSQERSGTQISYSQVYGYQIFTANQDATYSLSGIYGLQGTGDIYSAVYLYDEGNGAPLFIDESAS